MYFEQVVNTIYFVCEWQENATSCFLFALLIHREGQIIASNNQDFDYIKLSIFSRYCPRFLLRKDKPGTNFL